METYLRLSAIAAFPVIFSIILYSADKKTSFGKIDARRKQLIYGLVFGGLAVLGTEYGVDIGGAVANTRDAAVLTAGLLFGAPAGIIAGIIGGVERFFAVYWGAGTYTRLACTLSTVFAGFFGAVLRKFMFDNKKPSSLYALGIGIVTEVIHMLMIFFTNMSDVSVAFGFVERCALPMITVNGLSVMLSVLAVALLGKEKRTRENRNKQITTVFQRWLLICVVAAFIITSVFTLVLQTEISDNDSCNLLSLNISDVTKDISDASDANLLSLTHTVAAEINKGGEINGIAAEHGIAEINLVDERGIITASTTPEFVGYDMAGGEQSREFTVLLDGTEEFVQSYQPISYDSGISRKYAGVALPDGGFVQVGYDAAQFRQDIAAEVVSAARNRHVGKNGCIIIADEYGNIVSDTSGDESGRLDGVVITSEKLDVPQGERFTAEYKDEKSYCMYTDCEGYWIVAVLPVSEAVFSRNISVYITVFMEIVVFVGLFILIYFLIKKLVVNNIRRVNDSLSLITGGNLNVTVDVRTNEEFASLSDDINSTVVTLKRYIAEAAARIDKELVFAKSIQHSSLPSVFPPYPNRSDFDIFARMDTAKEVGGDFYDFYLTSHSELVFLIADVSGKGIPAAMFMMRAKTIIKSYAETGMNVEDVFTRANEKLCESNDAEMFVTAWLGKLNLETGLVSFANAGHNPPLVRHADGGFEYLKSRAGFVLAGMDGIKYRKNEVQLAPGDTLFLYTDGVTEATSAETELYGEDRLKAVLDKSEADTSEQLCSAVIDDVNAFVGEAPQFDDITMLCLKFKGEVAGEELTVDAAVENIETVTAFVDEQLEKHGCPTKAQLQLDIAIDELFGNIAHYAYSPNAGTATVRVEFTDSPLSVIVTFIDSGVPYNPLSKPDPDTSLSAEERQIGGLGIFMVKKSMDDITYEFKDGQNILKIKKIIGG